MLSWCDVWYKWLQHYLLVFPLHFQQRVVHIAAEKTSLLMRIRAISKFLSSTKCGPAQLNHLTALKKLHMMFYQCRNTGCSMCTSTYWINSVVKRGAIWERGWVSSPLRRIDFCISLNWLKDMMNSETFSHEENTWDGMTLIKKGAEHEIKNKCYSLTSYYCDMGHCSDLKKSLGQDTF